ncbi:hypothetical protein NYE40_22960 [Paenibacillus sp. FSL W8-1187]|uniref:Uncharacterized protein n=1 Tax=Paenibacillus pasadenensis TaxID=217090 RepID=A0A2N5ND05_9BACL|nr:hypothetical protein [Paenibacillus pasadenensis]PLT48227.1 hypothetical protein B8V81_0359 [Paenibacillus pasadenensis]
MTHDLSSPQPEARSSRPLWKGHLIRWIVILLLAALSFSPFWSGWSRTPEGAANRLLYGFEYPPASLVSSLAGPDRVQAALLLDREHGLIHQVKLKRILGVLWSGSAIGISHPMDEDIAVNMLWSINNDRRKSTYMLAGQIGDGRIASIRIAWPDGNSSEPVFAEGFYQAFHVTPLKDGEPPYRGQVELQAYDKDGKLLYEVSESNREARFES